MSTDNLRQLQMNLREETSPFFSDEELMLYLEKNNNNIRSATYECLLLKAEDDSIALPGGLSLPNNKNYWIMLAKKYRPNGSGIL